MPRKQHSHHYIYKTTCTVTGRYYIGMHSTSNLEDDYIGSGKRLWLSIRKYGRESHVREILEFLPDRKTLASREKEIVNEELIRDENCMNLKHGGFGGFCNEEHKNSFHEKGAKAGGYKMGKKHMLELNERIINDAEYRKKWLDSRPDQSGDKNHFYGKTHSEQAREKMSAKSSGQNNSQYGKIWIYNEIYSSRINKKDKDFYISNGWKIGRKMNLKYTVLGPL